MVDLLLAILHHVLVFSLAGMLAAELALVRDGLGGSNLRLLARIDGLYGGIAGAVIVVGILRVLFGIRGWEYYVYYPVFWLKIAAFLTIGALSAGPTRRIIAWRRSLDADPGFKPAASEIGAVRRILMAEAALLVLVLAFAAAMARAIGY